MNGSLKYSAQVVAQAVFEFPSYGVGKNIPDQVLKERDEWLGDRLINILKTDDVEGKIGKKRLE